MALPFQKIYHAVGKTLERWTKPVTIVAGLVSLAWVLLLIPVAKRSLHLVTWIKDDVTVYPSQVSSNRVLPLSYLGHPVQSARILSVRIQNRGNAPIGSSQDLWSLYLTASTASNLVLLEDPKVTPTPLVLKVLKQKQNESPRTLELVFGVFDPRVTVDLELLLINAENSRPPLTAASTLVGLPNEVTIRSPSDQLASRYFWYWASPILLLLSVPFLPPLWREWYQKTPVWRRLMWSPAYLLLALVVLGGPAAIWVVVLAHIVAWLY